jgi:hypothetical protein
MFWRNVEEPTRALAVACAVRRVRNAGSNLLLILPSTIGALHLARALCARDAWRITTGTVVGQARWGLTQHLRTPGQIVREFSGQQILSPRVISFPDQLAGEGDAFLPIPFLGEDRRFSLLEALLVLRHRPRVYGLRSCLPRGCFRLVEVNYQDLAAPSQHSTPALLMQRLLSVLESELAHPPRDWLAAGAFALKTPAGFENHLREEFREIESLLRLALFAAGGEKEMIQSLLARLSEATSNARRARRKDPRLH